MAKSGGTGTSGMPQLTAVTGAYSFVANPYASVVNWLSLDKNDISSTIYIYDPTISGSSGRGAYVAYNGALNTNSTSNSSINNHIQSGQAFFVETRGPNPSITFKETYKSTSSRLVYRTAANEIPNLSIQLLLPSQVGTTAAADGARVYFSKDFSSSIDDGDSYKFTNLDENIAIVRNEKTLSIEGRKPVMDLDTIALKLWQLTQPGYTLKATLENFDNNINAFLQDDYLHTATSLNANSETLVPFKITSDPASFASNRFNIVFKTITTLPVTLTGVKAILKNEEVEVNWGGTSENSVNTYDVERSADAHSFKRIGSVVAQKNQQLSYYNFFDHSPQQGDNYYRIKSVSNTGEVSLSEVVRVMISSQKNNITIINNPITVANN